MPCYLPGSRLSLCSAPLLSHLPLCVARLVLAGLRRARLLIVGVVQPCLTTIVPPTAAYRVLRAPAIAAYLRSAVVVCVEREGNWLRACLVKGR
jgi:hypothetical protein